MSHSLPTVILQPIGLIRTPFDEKFGIPRQPGLIPEAKGIIQLHAPYNRAEALTGLEEFSHLWLSWQFHQVPESPNAFKPTVRPPRLGGNTRIGVFASRSPFRPNRIGLSALAIEHIDHKKAQIHVSGVDMLDNTPIFDIKPYVGYTDALINTRDGFANKAPEPTLEVRFEASALEELRRIAANDLDTLKALIKAVIAQNPAPAYQTPTNKTYGMKLAGLDIHWQIHQAQAADAPMAHILNIRSMR